MHNNDVKHTEGVIEVRAKELQMKMESRLQLDKYKDSLDTVYEIMARLNKYTTEEMLFYSTQLLADLTHSKDVAIYTIVNKTYARLFSATSPEARKLGNSIKYAAIEDVYQELLEGRIYLNTAMDENLPLMAGAVYAEEKIQLILMFWGMPSHTVTSADANRLTVIITLIQNSLLRAKRLMVSFRKQNYLEGSNVLNEEAFTALVKTFLEARDKGLAECTLLEIVLGYEDYEPVSRKLACDIRQTDYMGIIDGRKLYILLTNTDAKNAEVVQTRLQKTGYRSLIKENIL